MKKEYFLVLLRWLFTLLLVYGSYREAGFFTATSLFLLFIATEIQGFIANRRHHVR